MKDTQEKQYCSSQPIVRQFEDEIRGAIESHFERLQERFTENLGTDQIEGRIREVLETICVLSNVSANVMLIPYPCDDPDDFSEVRKHFTEQLYRTTVELYRSLASGGESLGQCEIQIEGSVQGE